MCIHNLLIIIFKIKYTMNITQIDLFICETSEVFMSGNYFQQLLPT